MLSQFNAPLTMPTSAYSVSANPKTAYIRGSSMNSAVYVVKPEDLTSLPGVQALQLTYTANRRGVGQRGSNRGQILTQAIALDAQGRQQITSLSPTLTEPNFFVPPDGVAYDQAKVSEAVLALTVAFLLNASGSNTQLDWLKAFRSGTQY